MEFINRNDITILSNPGVTQPRHTHEGSEQIWCALAGSGSLLLEGNKTKRFSAGDLVRIEKGEVHGLYNDGEECFAYVSVTTPPIDFGYAYKDRDK